MLVLIIDDDHEDCELFQEAINELNGAIECIAATDGRHAIQLLHNGMKRLPDYIFLDINMPVMNGRETLLEIRKSPTCRQIPVIMYSTTSDPREIKSYLKLGADNFLVKPHNFNKLVEALRSIIVVNQTKPA